MGLLQFRQFSSIPNLLKKIQSKTREKERFTPTFLENASRNNLQIVSSRTNTGNLYVVPTDRIFFLCTVSTSIRNTLLIGVSQIFADPSFGNPRLSQSVCEVGGQANADLTFSMPIRFEAGNSFDATIQGTGSALITGFEISSSSELV